MADTAIKPSIKLTDETFLRKAGKGSLHLSMELSHEFFAFAITDKQRNEHAAFEVYHLTDAINFLSALTELQQVFEYADLLKNWQGTASLAINHQYATIIPNPVFNEAKMEQYLDINFELDADDLVLYDELTNVKAKNVFNIPRKTHTFFLNRLKNLSFHHFSTALIEPFFLQYKNRDKPVVVINVQKISFQLIIFENRSLRLYNSYQYHNEDDFVYFIMFALEQLQLDVAKYEVKLTGFIDKESTTYKKLATYVSHISFEPFVPRFKSIVAEKQTGRNFYSLFNQYMCVS